MNDSGVTREAAIRALRAKKLDLSFSENNLVQIAGEGHMTTECIPPELGRRQVHRLSRLYKVPIHWFYNPLMIPGDEEKRPPS